MITLLLLGSSLLNVDGHEVKQCFYRHKDLPHAVSMALPKSEKCPTKLKLGN